MIHFFERFTRRGRWKVSAQSMTFKGFNHLALRGMASSGKPVGQQTFSLKRHGQFRKAGRPVQRDVVCKRDANVQLRLKGAEIS